MIPLAHPVRPEEVKTQFLYTSIVLLDMLIKASCPLWFARPQESAHVSFLGTLNQGHTLVPYFCKVHFHT